MIGLADFSYSARCLFTISESAAKLGATTVHRFGAQLLFDTQQLVVLGDTVRTAQRTGLDLASRSTDCQVGNGRIFGFAGTVRDHRRVTSRLGHLDGFQGFGQVPIWLNLIRIELPIFLSMTSFSILVLVTNMSSPTSWILSPILSVRTFQPAQSDSSRPSSMEMIGCLLTRSAR